MKKIFQKSMITMTKSAIVALAILALPGHAFAAGCANAGKTAAAEQGGELVAAKPVTQSGAAMCEVVLLVKTSNGLRKRVTVVVPQDS